MTYLSFLHQTVYAGHTLFQYMLAGAFFLFVLIGLKIFQLVILARLKSFSKKTNTVYDDALIEGVSHIGFLFYLVVSLYAGIRVLEIPVEIMHWINAIVSVIVAHAVIRTVGIILDHAVRNYAEKRGESENSEQEKKHAAWMGRLFKNFFIILLWSVLGIFLLSNFGIDVTSIVAGLGIGGIAIALALQNILSDIFSSFSIFIDKPFEVGHFISVGADSGTVEKIGLKTTRLRTLRGEELIISNKELTSARVQNFRMLKKRRDTVSFGIVYGVTQKMLKEANKIAQTVVDKTDHAEFERCHMISFGGSSLDFELVYLIDTDDYLTFRNTRQSILMALYAQFAKAGIEFAYPTQTIFLEKGDV